MVKTGSRLYSTLKGEIDTNPRLLAFLVFAFAVAVPIVTRSYLNAPISISAIVFLVVPVVAIGYAGRRYGAESSWIGYVSSLVNALCGGLVLIGILITPLSVYESWFDSFRFGSPEGGVSNLFVVITGYFAAILGPLMVTMGVLWPVLVVVFALLYLAAIVVQNQFFLFLVLGSLVLPATYLSIRSAVRVRRSGTLYYSIGLVVASLVIALVIPKFEGTPGNQFVNDTVYPKLRSQVIATMPRFPLLYSVPGYGIRFDEKQLGGVPTLLPNPIFQVSGVENEQVYIRSRIFDSYDGSSWSMSRLFEEQTTDPSSSSLFGEWDDGDVGPDDIKITLTAKQFAFLPYTLDTDMIMVKGGLPEINEGSLTTGFQLREPLSRGDEVYLRRNDGRNQLSHLPMSNSQRRLYLQIPDDLPPELRVIADGLAAGNTDPEQILANIEDFLAQNYTYSLEVDAMEYMAELPIPQSSDFVYSFLFNSSGGYCVQFATSFIILARLNSIPARYATGYLTFVSSEEGVSEVTGLSAHAWPEVWVDGKGWINWEATPAANIANYSAFGADMEYNYNVDLNETTSRQIETLMGGNFAPTPRTRVSPARLWRISLLAIAVIAAATGVIIAARRLLRGIHYIVRDDSGKFYHHARRLSRTLGKKGIAQPGQVGWLAWFDQVEESVHGSGAVTEPMRVLMLRLTYTDDEVTREHISEMSEFSRYLRKQLRRSNGDLPADGSDAGSDATWGPSAAK